MNEKNKSNSVKRLYEAFALLKNSDDIEKFFDDICTVNEVLDMAQRLDTAIMLSNGCNYINISKKMGISTATISRVSRCLNFGDGGYSAAINKLPKTLLKDLIEEEN